MEVIQQDQSNWSDSTINSTAFCKDGGKKEVDRERKDKERVWREGKEEEEEKITGLDWRNETGRDG